MIKDFSILIGGAAGRGSRKGGFLIAKLLSKIGYNIFIYDDYQSLIRGGHSFSKIRAAEKKVLSHKEKIDFLLALDKETLDKHIPELSRNGILVYNNAEISCNRRNSFGIDLKEIIKEEGGKEIMENVALVASFAKIIGIRWRDLKTVLEKELKRFLEINIKIAKKAFSKSKEIVKIPVLPKAKKEKSLLTGNEALALGAVKAGLGVYIAYPMTPATGILSFLAEKKNEFDVKVIQFENEIGVVSAAIGAAYSGVRTMVGTSGGGFSLMAESISLSAQSEIPLMVVLSQRIGPATGIPTYTAQSDLLFALNVGHGDFLRFVVAPGDAEEAAVWAGRTLNLSWKFQIPSIFLVDKQISESTFTFDKNILKQIKFEKPLLWDRKGRYLRYKKTKDGISPLAFPGTKGAIVKTNSYEHDEFGITVEDEKLVKEMQEKRLKKFTAMEKEVEKLPSVAVYGEKKSRIVIIGWGSTKGPAKEAAENLGIKMVQPIVLEPFPQKSMVRALGGAEKIILVETNATGQLEKVLNAAGIKVDKKILKYTGRPFTAEEIKKKIEQLKIL